MPDSQSTRSARLLLIEDEATVARLTELVLTSEGYSVDVVTDYTSVPELLLGQHYDLILADTDLGARTAGLESLTPLVKSAAPSPVLLFSAHRFPASEIAEAGLAGMIRKPYDIDEFLRTVRHALTSATAAGFDGGDAPSP